MRAKKPARHHLPLLEGKALRPFPAEKSPAGPFSVVCCIGQALLPVPHHLQLLHRHYQLHLPRRNPRVPRRPKQICPLTSMTRLRKDC